MDFDKFDCQRSIELFRKTLRNKDNADRNGLTPINCQKKARGLELRLLRYPLDICHVIDDVMTTLARLHAGSTCLNQMFGEQLTHKRNGELFGMRVAPWKYVENNLCGGNMDSDYVFLCGVMWCNYGQHEAGKELLRATTSPDLDIRALAWAMLARGVAQLRKKVLGDPAKPRIPETSALITELQTVDGWAH